MGSRDAFRSRLTCLIAIAVLLVAAAPAPAGASDATAANLIVGFDGRFVDLGLLQELGATVKAQSQTLGIAAVHAADPATFTELALLQDSVAWVETNDAIQASSSQWDSSQWDAAGWDSSQWDAAGWDAAGWDSSQWDAAGWDSSQWDAAGWDSSQWDSSQWDAAGWDAAGWDAAGWDAAGWDSSQWDAAGWDAAGWDAAGWDSAQMTSLGSTQGAAGTDPLLRWQWGIAAANVPRAAATTPSSAAICVVDSGVDYTHPDLAGHMWTSAAGTHGYDFVNKDHDPMDDGGHGTHVAGIAAAATGNGLGIAGVSQARIMAVKVLGATGVGTEADLAFGIEWCAKNGASVISMSLGTPENSKAVHRAVVDAFAKQIVMVASVGNTGTTCDCVQWPAAYPQVVAVGAVMPNGGRAPYSAMSHGVDLVAPGYAIVGPVPGGYKAAHGTSQAVPYVSAAAAVLLSAGADAPTATRAIKETALDLGPTGWDGAFGHGALNLGAALAQVQGS